ncbi:MAG TPA: ubiquinol-cytochrome c reductase iron-sulfur subunit [Thermoanaerobaculia bacterium]
MKEKTSRRKFLTKLGIGAGAVAVVGQAGAGLRSLVPNVSYDAPTTVKLGPVASYPEGMQFFPDERLFVFREGKTFYAISAVCTHLGCTVRAEQLQAPVEMAAEGKPAAQARRFLCPCHGSVYNGDGTTVSGPAPKPLAWHPLSIAPDDGQLVVDLAEEVDRDFRLTIA